MIFLFILSVGVSSDVSIVNGLFIKWNFLIFFSGLNFEFISLKIFLISLNFRDEQTSATYNATITGGVQTLSGAGAVDLTYLDCLHP